MADPLEKAKEALRRAHEAGDTAAAQKIAGYIKSQAQSGQQAAAPAAGRETSRASALGQGILQGATLGLADEAGAAGGAAIERLAPWLPKLLQSPAGQAVTSAVRGTSPTLGGLLQAASSVEPEEGRSFGEGYSARVGEAREQLQAAREQYPGTTFAGELAGGLLTAGAGGAAAAGQQTLRQALPRLAGTGAAFGAAAGAGGGEGVEGKLGGAAIGAATGGALGAAIPAAVSGVARAAGNVASRMGYRGAEKYAEEGARQTVLKALKNAGLAPKDAERMLAENPNLLLADLASGQRGTAGLTEDIVQAAGKGAEELSEALTKRAEEAYDRIIPAIQERLQGATRNFAEAEERIMKEAREAARPLYAEAHQTPVRITSRMQELLNRPSIKDAWHEAIREAADDGLAPEALGVVRGDPSIARATGSMVDPQRANMINMARLDYTIRNLQRKAQNTRHSAPADSRRYSNLARDLLKEVTAQNPVFQRARQIWAGAKADEDALELGRRIFSEDADVIQRALRGMSDSEKNHYYIGALRAIENRLGRKTDTSNMLRELRQTPHGRQLMRALTGSEEEFGKFLKLADAEIMMHETFAKATGGSATRRRLGGAAGEAGESLGVLVGILAQQHLGWAGLPFLTRKLSRRAAEAFARSDEMRRDATARLLMQRDPQVLMQALQGNPLRAGPVGRTLGPLAAMQEED